MRAMRTDTKSAGPGAMMHTGLFLMRVLVGASMIAFHAWALVSSGWRHFWRGEEWVLVAAVEKAGLPQPVIVSVVFALILFAGSVFLVLGLFGRLTSSALLLAMGGILYLALTKGIDEYIEPGLLYSTLYLGLTATGPGAICLDRLFVRRPRPLPSSLQDIV